MKRLLLSLAILLSAATCWGQVPLVAVQSQAERLEPPAVRVVVEEPQRQPGQRGESWGSGVLAASDDNIGIVLTAWHVISEARAADAVKVRFVGNNHDFLGTILDSDRIDDLAAIAIRAPGYVKPLKIADTVSRGEILTAAGFGSNTTYRVYRGRTTQFLYAAQQSVINAVEWQGGSRQGDSGGPVVNERGELVSVISASNGGISTGARPENVRTFLAKVCSARQNMPQPVQFCPGGSCRPPGYGYGYGGAPIYRQPTQPPIVEQPPAPAPSNPPISENAPPFDPPAPSVTPADLDKLREQLQEQNLAIVEIQKTLVLIAEREGKPGPPGKDGKDATIDYQEFASIFFALYGEQLKGKDGQAPDLDSIISEIERRKPDVPANPVYFDIQPRNK